MFYDHERLGPATHALVIGVGSYPYLEFGGPTGLGQLRSAPVSALAFAQWLASGDHARWSAPLASIELLANAPDGAVAPAPEVDAPTIDNIQLAFDRWLRRCEEYEDNVSILYFCGHGVQGDQQILLASDFARYPGSPYRGAFGFDATRLGLLQRMPRTQCIIIDACRVVLPSVWEQFDVDAQPLVSARRTAPRCCEHDLTLRAAPFEAARALAGQVSYLTSAVLHAFGGQAATRDEFGDWVVRTDTIAVRIDEIMQQCVRPVGKPQRVARGEGFSSRVLFRLDAAPGAQLRCQCHPGAAAPHAAMACTSVPPLPSGGAFVRSDAGEDPWHIDLTAGFYEVSARFADGSYVDRSLHVLVEPPVSLLSLRVR